MFVSHDGVIVGKEKADGTVGVTETVATSSNNTNHTVSPSLSNVVKLFTSVITSFILSFTNIDEDLSITYNTSIPSVLVNHDGQKCSG